jgi:hypothetical protein
MIHELREYRLNKPDWPVYRELFYQLCLPIRGSRFGEFLGGWETEDTDSIRFLHLWQYPSLDERARLRRELANIPEWTEVFVPRSRVLIRDQMLSVLNPLSISLPAEQCSLYLHRYRCSTGGASALVNHLQTSAPQGQLSLWMAEFPNPNEVLQLHRATDSEAFGGVCTADGLRCVKEVCSQILKPLCLSDL